MKVSLCLLILIFSSRELIASQNEVYFSGQWCQLDANIIFRETSDEDPLERKLRFSIDENEVGSRFGGTRMIGCWPTKDCGGQLVVLWATATNYLVQIYKADHGKVVSVGEILSYSLPELLQKNGKFDVAVQTKKRGGEKKYLKKDLRWDLD